MLHLWVTISLWQVVKTLLQIYLNSANMLLHVLESGDLEDQIVKEILANMDLIIFSDI